MQSTVLSRLDERYAKRSDLQRFERELLDRKAAGILHSEYRDTKTGGPKVLVTRALFGEVYRRRHGVWPSGRTDAEAREYRVAQAYVTKAISEGTTTAGGFVVPEEWDTALIPSLKAQSAVFAMGPTIRETKKDILRIPAVDAAKTFVWSAENTDPGEQSPTFREIVLQPRKAIGRLAISNEWLEDADSASDDALRDELLGSLAEFVDAALLEGSGSNRPTGLRSISGISALPAIGTLTYDDLIEAEFTARNDNVRPPYAWLAHPRSERSIKLIKDSDGRPLFLNAPNFANELRPLGYPIFSSTQVAVDEGASSDETYILLVRPADVIVALRRPFGLAISEHVGFNADQSMIRLTVRVDLDVTHVESVVALTGIMG